MQSGLYLVTTGSQVLRFSGSWFQVSAAGVLTIVGAWGLLRTAKGLRVKPTIIFFLSVFLVLTGLIGAINAQ